MDAFLKKVSKAMSKATDAKSMRKYGETVVDVVVARTRYKGQGVAFNGGRVKKLKNVTPEYADQRTKLPRHPDAATGRNSNLTQTGEMLDSLTVTKATKKQVAVGWKDKDEREKAGYVEAAGRPFLNLTSREIDIVSRELDKKLSKETKKV